MTVSKLDGISLRYCVEPGRYVYPTYVAYYDNGFKALKKAKFGEHPEWSPNSLYRDKISASDKTELFADIRSLTGVPDIKSYRYNCLPLQINYSGRGDLDYLISSFFGIYGPAFVIPKVDSVRGFAAGAEYLEEVRLAGCTSLYYIDDIVAGCTSLQRLELEGYGEKNLSGIVLNVSHTKMSEQALIDLLKGLRQAYLWDSAPEIWVPRASHSQTVARAAEAKNWLALPK